MITAAAAGFEIGSATHAVTVAACALAVLFAVWLGRRVARRDLLAEWWLRFAVALAIGGFQLFSQVWQNVPGHLDARVTLPLHLCDLAGLLAPFALASSARWPRTLLYFWGLGLSAFAFALPMVREGPDSIWFWLFWIGHLQIVGSAVYLIAVVGYRPRLADAGLALAATAVYTAAVLPVDAVLGANYGIVGPDPSPAEVLGPWPGRAAALLALEAVLFALMWLPWMRGARRRD